MLPHNPLLLFFQRLRLLPALLPLKRFLQLLPCGRVLAVADLGLELRYFGRLVVGQE